LNKKFPSEDPARVKQSGVKILTVTKYKSNCAYLESEMTVKIQ